MVTFVNKRHFDIKDMLKKIEEAIKPYAKAAMFDLADRGHHSVYEQVIACLLSVRTRDETSLSVALRLFALAKTPEQMLKISKEKILTVIKPCTFSEQKLSRIIEISQIILDKYQGELPCKEEALLDLPGIGPKCANLVLGIVCGKDKISVDVHVHRVTNRWGYIHARNPIETTFELEKKLPYEYWTRLNALLVPFGKHICRGPLPRCTTCPVLSYCRQIGVEKYL